METFIDETTRPMTDKEWADLLAYAAEENAHIAERSRQQEMDCPVHSPDRAAMRCSSTICTCSDEEDLPGERYYTSQLDMSEDVERCRVSARYVSAQERDWRRENCYIHAHDADRWHYNRAACSCDLSVDDIYAI